MKRRHVGSSWFVAMVISVATTAVYPMAQGDSQIARFVADSRAAMKKMMAAMDVNRRR